MNDRTGRNITYLRLSVTERCDLRCRYCMPADAICREDGLSDEEIVLAARAAASLGIRKLRVTGGEPLVRRGIVELCHALAQIPGIEELCITTNGLALPELAVPLREAGVQRVNMSLDTLDPAKYRSITRVGSLERALRGLDAALSAGFEKLKINVVLIGGVNDDEIPALAALTQLYPLDVRFIELMPMVDGGFGKEAYLPASAVLDALPEAVPMEPDGGVARLYRLPGAWGNIGLISPLSAHICSSCDRIRLTSDGKLKPCLHSPSELSIKGLGYEEMVRQFERAILEKPGWHGELSATARSRAGRSMNQIGG